MRTKRGNTTFNSYPFRTLRPDELTSADYTQYKLEYKDWYDAVFGSNWLEKTVFDIEHRKDFQED
jgi:hypothetical protein